MQEIMQFIIHYPILSITWISLLAIVLFNMFRDITSKVKNITSIEATRLINKEDAVVIDLREINDFYNGHIAGAIHLLPDKIKSNNIGELKKHKAKPIIVVDSTGMQAHKPANALSKAGFKKVCILKEGIYGWNNENLPLIKNK